MQKTKTSISVASAVSALLAFSASIDAYASDLNARHRFSIPAQPVDAALLAFSDQAKVQVLMWAEAQASALSSGATGDLRALDALKAILENTGLTFQKIDDETIAIVEPGAKPRTIPASFERTSLSVTEEATTSVKKGETRDSRVRMAQIDEGQETADEKQSVRLEEVIVTGSHIRGAQNLSSPVIRFDREDIERSGSATTQDFMRSLPQNLGNVSDSTIGSANGGQTDAYTYSGSGINLRGVGADATLVLLNGRRFASAGNGSFVDISLIPLNAIERIEVLTDGASAIYGSDAVGGVVNLVMRDDYEGGETRVRYGSVTEGTHDEAQVGQMFGHSWRSGQALVSYEYFRRTPLEGSDRDFFDPAQAYTGMVLIPEQKRHGAVATINQNLSDSLKLSGDVFFARRNSAYNVEVASIIPVSTDSEVNQYGGSVQLSKDLVEGWQVRLSGMLDQNDSDQQYSIHFPDGAQGYRYGNKSRLWSADLAADGSLMSAPGGDVRLALGGHLRGEEFAEEFSVYPSQLERDVKAAYAELLVPWVSEHNRRLGFERLQLTLAARYEKYSDFGSTFNPKFGLAWAPVGSLDLRGTWGTSFKAPLLTQLNPEYRHANVYEGYFVDATGTATVLSLSGNGENLGPEESENWTIGFDFSPEAIPSLSISATYFDIDYDERIRTPFPGRVEPSVLLDPVYETLITRGPSEATVQDLLARARHTTCYTQVTGSEEVCDPFAYTNRVAAILDERVMNIAGIHLSGIDFSASYQLTNAVGDWGLTLAGSQMLKNRQRLVPGGPVTSELNDVWRPVDLRLRTILSLSREGSSLVAAINYTDNYHDTRTNLGASVPRSSVSSWTTVDLTAQYELSRHWKSWGGEITLQLSAINLFDRDPPYVASAYGMYYDAVNASPIGRFVSAQLTARW